MKAKEFDKQFDSGEDVLEYLELAKARRVGQEQKRVNVDFPVWMIHSLDKEAKRLGIPRQSLIKVLIAQHIEHAGA
ncbi:MAG: CopG family transcriptional regulator [Candidatus Sabulitectum sp.]|nr:CopG family transcriptional regulator [Candidatus Sabulitectum sp.]